MSGETALAAASFAAAEAAVGADNAAERCEYSEPALASGPAPGFTIIGPNIARNNERVGEIACGRESEGPLAPWL